MTLIKVNFFIILFLLQIIFCESTYNALELSSNATSHSLHNGAVASKTKYLNVNPASIFIEHNQFEISQLLLPSDILSSNVSYTWMHKKMINFLKINSVNYGKLKDDFNKTEFRANDIFFEIGQKIEYKELISFGYSIGYLNSSIDQYSSSGIFSNIGLRMDVFNKRLSIGATLNNIGFQLRSYIKNNEFLPTSMRYGISFKPLYFPAYVYIDFIKYINYENTKLQIGLDFNIKNQFNFRISTINNRHDLNTNQYYKDIFNNFSFGLGLKIKNKNINLSLQNMGPAGLVYGFSILL